MRTYRIEIDVNRYAEGSVLIEAGNTRVLCTASVEESVPGWLKGKGSGWVTGEYSMLPRATHTRTKREREKVSGRTHEIQRLIGRSLRGCVNLATLGERSVLVDCDVLQADGGTRTTAINGACLALAIALHKIGEAGKLDLKKVWVDTIQAISVGVKDGVIYTDLDYELDSTCDVDMNFVRLGSGKFIEVQGTAERQAFDQSQLLAMLGAANQAMDQLRDQQMEILKDIF
jgi:ribonuclease PH